MATPPVQYAKTTDGFDIAYGVSGAGSSIVVPPFARSHVQLNWQNDLVLTRRVPFLSMLAEHLRVITFDDRGQGLSSRNLPHDLSLQHFDMDMDAVAEAIPDDRFALLGCARAGHLAVRYAVRHPERVTALVLISCPISFQAWSYGLWDRLPMEHYDFFLQTQLLPGISPEDGLKAVALLKETVTPEAYQRAWALWQKSDITNEVRILNLPTLVLHPRAFALLPPEESVKLAASISGASMSMIDGADFLGDANQGVRAICDFFDGLNFLAEIPTGRHRVDMHAINDAPEHLDFAAAEFEARGMTSALQLAHLLQEQHFASRAKLPDNLSLRELEVLRLVAAGQTNQQIADALVISRNTVRRHVSNIFDKTGIVNRAQAGVYARDNGLV